MNTHDSTRRPPRIPPPLASAWGDDEFGLWAAFELRHTDGKVIQRMRWIEPGTFWMGSPEDEPERHVRGGYTEGPRHLVTLTRGLWLADTTCAQELWTAVMGS